MILALSAGTHMLDFFLFIFKYLKHNKMLAESEPVVGDHQNDLELFWWITFFAALSASVPALVKVILATLVGSTGAQSVHKDELKALKEQLREVNMMDEFAKHAKIQRKINKLTETISSESNSKGMFKMKLQVFSYFALYAVTGLIMMYITWTYKFVPVLVLNKDLFYPLNNILAFPTGVEGAIGIVAWIAMVSRASRNFYNFFQ